MHYLMEAIIHPQFAHDIEGTLDAALKEYCEGVEDEDGWTNPHSFWDFYVIGGRYDQQKLIQMFDKDTVDKFFEEVVNRGVTVSSLMCGPQELVPASQEPEVDELFRSFFPDWEGPCPYFKHGLQNQYADAFGGPNVCKLSDVPRDYTCFRVVIIGIDFEGKPDIVNMVEREIFNGATILKTEWSGKLLDAVDLHHENMKHYREDYKERNTVTDDWLTVTIDYHT